MKKLFLLTALTALLLPSYSQTDTIHLLFETNKYELTAEHKREIDLLISKKDQISRIKIAGHTDNVGKEDYNLKLSGKRAKAVSDYLKQCGVDTSLLFVKFYGMADPRVPNSSVENQSKNRRVDIVNAWKEDTVSIAKKPVFVPKKFYQVKFTNGVMLDFHEDDFDKSTEMNLVMHSIDSGGGEPPVQLIETTEQMKANSMLTMTIDNEVLVSQVIVRFPNECSLICDSMVTVRIPVNYPLRCLLEQLSFYRQVLDGDVTKWQLNDQKFTLETIGGKPYLVFKTRSACGTINFDFKACCTGNCNNYFEVRKKKKLFPKVSVSKIQFEDPAANMLYIPRKIESNRYELTIAEESKEAVRLTANLVHKNGKVYQLKNLALAMLRFDTVVKTYYLTKKDLKAYKK